MSSLEIFNDIEQGSERWFQVRAGLPTASEFATILMQGRTKGSPSATRLKYLYTLAGEIITGKVEDSYTNFHMERGKIMEAEARDCYAMLKGVEPQRVGFVRNGRMGCSPDSLIDANGLLEIKTALPHIQLDRLLANVLPSEHVAQVQGQIWTAEREWCDFTSYWPGMKPLIVRVYRDDAYVARLKVGVDEFNDELDALVEKYRQI